MADETMSSIEAPKPPAVNPISGPASSQAATLKLKPVIRKPVIGGAKGALKMPSKPSLSSAAPATPVSAAPATPVSAAPADSASSSVAQLKTISQKLKAVTQQIPQQAILHKTGIIAEQKLADAQKMASKSRTSRISLSDAIGASPVQNEAAPMKTIRIKRPVNLNSAPTAVESPAKPAAPAAAPSEAPESSPSVTQRRTLKISRPGAVRPMGKFAAKKVEKPAEEKAAEGKVDDIPEIPDIPAPAAAPVVVNAADDNGGVPTGLLVFDTILQFAACFILALVGVFIYYFDYSRIWF